MFNARELASFPCAVVLTTGFLSGEARADIRVDLPFDYSATVNEINPDEWTVTITRGSQGGGGTVRVYSDVSGSDTIVSLTLKNFLGVENVVLQNPTPEINKIKEIQSITIDGEIPGLGAWETVDSISATQPLWDFIGTMSTEGSITADIAASGTITTLSARGSILGDISAPNDRIRDIIAGDDGGSGNVGAVGNPITIQCGEQENTHVSLKQIVGDAIYANIDATLESAGNVGRIETRTGNFEGSLLCYNLTTVNSVSGVNVAGDLNAAVTVLTSFADGDGIDVAGNLVSAVDLVNDIDSPIIVEGNIAVEGSDMGVISTDGSLTYDGVTDFGQVIVNGDVFGDIVIGEDICGEIPGEYILDVQGVMDGYIEVGHDVTSAADLFFTSIEPAAEMWIARQFAGDIDIFTQGLQGQVIINTDDDQTNGGWQTGGTVRIGDTPIFITLNGPGYTATPNQFGGGAVGEVKFMLHDEACEPVNNDAVNGPLDEIRLRFYGPVKWVDSIGGGGFGLLGGSKQPLQVFFDDGNGEVDVTDEYDFTLEPYTTGLVFKTTILIEREDANPLPAGDYRIVKTQYLKCDYGNTPPQVRPFTYDLTIN